MPFRLTWPGRAGKTRTGPWNAAVPAGQRVYAIGDIHGCGDQLDRLMRMIREDAARAGPGVQHTLVLLGDYVDRGPDSRGVLDRLAGGPPAGFGMVCLLGNHEDTMLRFLTDTSVGPDWLRFGGVQTLASYGVPEPIDASPPGGLGPDWLPMAQAALNRALPPHHLGFLSKLRLYLRLGDYLFVHAGIRPGTAIERQNREDLLWIRGRFLDSRADHGVVVVHGHTISDAPEMRANRIGIDTGAYAGGPLTCLVLEGTDRRFIQT